MSAAAWIVLVLFAIRLIAEGAAHGKSKPHAEYNIGNALAFVVIWGGLLLWGGFFAQVKP